MAAIPYIVSAVASGMSAYGKYKEGVAQQKQYNYQADVAASEGELAYKRGEKQSELIQTSASAEGRKQKTQAAQVASAQRAAMVANGIDLSSVTASDLASETMSKAKLDELSIRYNADINSWSAKEEGKYKRWAGHTQASQLRFAGKQAKASGQMGAFTTLLGGAASMAGMGLLSSGGGTAAVAGKGGYGAGTPSGARNMGTWTKF